MFIPNCTSCISSFAEDLCSLNETFPIYINTGNEDRKELWDLKAVDFVRFQSTFIFYITPREDKNTDTVGSFCKKIFDSLPEHSKEDFDSLEDFVESTEIDLEDYSCIFVKIIREETELEDGMKKVVDHQTTLTNREGYIETTFNTAYLELV